jgi:cell wall-associated NlpC family hydrolase
MKSTIRYTALSFCLSLILGCIFFGATANFAYANSVTVSGGQQATASVGQAANGGNIQISVASDTLNVRSGPGTGYEPIGQLHLGATVQAKTHSDGNWYQINFHGKTGWVAGWLVQVYQPPSVDASRGLVSGIASIAERFLGRPYHYGGSGPYSFDCSGFTRYVFSQIGIQLPHTANGQAQLGVRVASPSPGDLVFFGSKGYMTHVGIYIGNNSFINAANYGSGVTISSLSDFSPRYAEARRII